MEQMCNLCFTTSFHMKCSSKVKIHHLPRNERARKDTQCACLNLHYLELLKKANHSLKKKKKVGTTFAD